MRAKEGAKLKRAWNATNRIFCTLPVRGFKLPSPRDINSTPTATLGYTIFHCGIFENFAAVVHGRIGMAVCTLRLGRLHLRTSPLAPWAVGQNQCRH